MKMALCNRFALLNLLVLLILTVETTSQASNFQGARKLAPSLAPTTSAAELGPAPVSVSPSTTPVAPPAQAPSVGGNPSVAPVSGNGSINAPTSPDTGLSGVFDVTKYGATADGKTDNKVAFSTAWANACKYEGESTFLVPPGTFLVGPIEFAGPCYNQKSPKVEIRGTVKAPGSVSAFPKPTWLTFRGLCELNITGAGTGLLDGQGDLIYNDHSGCHNSGGNCKNYPCTLRLIKISGGTISNIALLNSKGFHINFSYGENILVHDINITAPGNSPNTDGIHISDSTNINITSSTIGVGDDCISIGPGNTNIDVSKVNCGPGHGISVGSLGKYPHEKEVVGVHVKNCTITGTQNGVRVKSWPGAPANRVSNFTFEDIVMVNVDNPIIIDQEYCPGHGCKNIKPSLVKISDIHFKNIRGSSTRDSAVKLVCSSAVPCENVELVDIDLSYPNGQATSTCSNVKGTTSGKQNPTPCL